MMFARMQRYASELFEARNISYDFILPQEALGALNIDMRHRQHIYLIFKEAVNNLIKYAGASKVEIVFKVSKKNFVMQISDDGVGFDLKREHSGNGIFNMRKRAQEINAILKIKSSPGAGTVIEFIADL